MTTPEAGDYGCVQITWLHKTLFGKSILVPNIIGYLIRLATWSRYDHSFVYIGHGVIIESQSQGAKMARLGKYRGDAIIWSADKLTLTERKAVTQKALSLRGVPYGFLDIVYLGLATIGFKFKWLLKRVEREDRLICSQLVAVCGNSAGVDAWLCDKPNACLVTPADLARHASEILVDKTKEVIK